jgi:hypothetical protein
MDPAGRAEPEIDQGGGVQVEVFEQAEGETFLSVPVQPGKTPMLLVDNYTIGQKSRLVVALGRRQASWHTAG